jgi:hypothetical protein
MPDAWIIAECPLCHERRRYLPAEIFRGRLSGDPYRDMPRINPGMVYLGACLIAGIRLAREKQVNMRVVPTSQAIDESIEMAYEMYTRVFSR